MQDGVCVDAMTDPAHMLWLQTLTALTGLAVGLMLHLKWHPLRDAFSDAWEMLSLLSWLVPAMASLQLLAGEGTPWSVPSQASGSGLVNLQSETWLKLLGESVQGLAAMMHGFFPPWPAALALPVALSLLVWRVAKFPYRYHSRKKKPWVLRLLIIGCAVTWLWLGMEIVSWIKPMPESLETLRVMIRWLAQALMMAGLQIWMIRLVITWDEPEDPDDQQDAWLSLEHTLARWQGVMALAGLNLLWLLAWKELAGSGSGLALAVLVESALLFATVPLILAWTRGSLWLLAEAMMAVLLRSWLPVLGFILSAAALFLLVHLAMASMLSWVAESPAGTAGMRILIALVLATVRSWLFLAFVLTLLRHGLKTAALREQAN